VCGRIAHEWPAYTPAHVARLPFSYWRALRALLLRAKYTSSRARDADDGLKSVDVDKLLGIEEQKETDDAA
jgi:hypothetical protein